VLGVFGGGCVERKKLASILSNGSVQTTNIF